MHISISLLVAPLAHTFFLHSGMCRLQKASSVVFVLLVEAQGHDLAKVTTTKLIFMLSPVVCTTWSTECA